MLHLFTLHANELGGGGEGLEVELETLDSTEFAFVNSSPISDYAQLP